MTSIDAYTTLIPPPPPIKNVCVRYDIWVSSICGMVSLAGIIFIVIKECQSKTLCKGYKYRNTYTICIFFFDCFNYVPITIGTMAGHLHKVSVNTLLHKCQLKLNKGFIWDTISIDWKTVCREGVPKLKQYLKHLCVFHSATLKLYLFPIKSVSV